MAIALVQNPYAELASGSSAQTLTLTQAITVGNLIAVCVVYGKASGANISVSSITDNAGSPNTYTAATLASNTQNNPKLDTEIWYCLSATAAPTTITVTFSGVNNFGNSAVGMLEYSGVSPAVLDVVNSTTTNLTSTPTATGAAVTTTGTDDVIVSIICTDAISVSSVASPFTNRGNSTYMMVDAINQVAGTYTPTYTTASNIRYATSTASFATSSTSSTTRLSLTHVGN